MSVIGSKQGRPAPGRSPVELLSVPAGCAALLAVLVYLNALDNPFVYDDFRLIVENPAIANELGLRALIVLDITRPLVPLSYGIDTMLWGRSPFGYHVTNLFFHVVNVVLVFWVAVLASEDRARQAGQRLGAAASPTAIGFATAAMFAVHPMMTQAVGYISSRSEVLYATFFLLALLAGRRWMLAGGTRWWVACVALWVGAMLAKETAVLLPVILLLYDRLVLDADVSERRRRFRQLQLPMLGAMVGAGAVRAALLGFVEYPEDVGPDWRYALIAVDGFWRYLTLFFVPRDQSIFHAVPAIDGFFSLRAISGVVGLVALTLVAWGLRHVHSLLTLGLLWFGLLLVPSSALFVLGLGEAIAEHRAYLAGFGLFLTWGCTFGMLWTRPRRERVLVALTLAVFLAQLSFQTFLRNVIWQDPVMLSREAVDLAPGHWMPRILLAEALRQNGRCPEAVPVYRAAIEVRPNDEFPYTRLTGCLLDAQRHDEAEAVLEQLRALNPTSADASMGLGVFAILRGNLHEARAHLQEVLIREPGRVYAKEMLDFVEGALPPADHLRLCAEFWTVAGGVLPIDSCPPQEDSDSAVTPRH